MAYSTSPNPQQRLHSLIHTQVWTGVAPLSAQTGGRLTAREGRGFNPRPNKGTARFSSTLLLLKNFSYPLHLTFKSLAAFASSKRMTGVLCGADFTTSGFPSTSFAI